MKEMKTLTVNGVTYTVSDPDAAHIDDSVVGASAWSGKNIIDRLCPAFTVSGPAVRCEPVAGYPLSIVAELPMDYVNFEKIHSKLTVFLRGKNLIPYPYKETTKQENGIFFDDNGDGSITICGTATADATFVLYNDSIAGWPVPVGTTIAFGGVDGSTKDTFHFFVTGTSIQRTYGDHKKTETIAEGMVIKTISIRVKAGTEFLEPVTIWPQIEVGNVPTAYEAYRGKEIELPFGEPVKGGTLDLDTGIIIDPEVYTETKLFEPQTISALPGINTVYCNTGTVNVTGRADPVVVIADMAAKVDSLTKTVAVLLEG